ncbi:MAG: amidase [Pseudomonadota bacterium]
MTLQTTYQETDAVGLSALFRSGEVTAREWVDVAIDLTEAWNPHINAVTVEFFDRARERASALDGDRASFQGAPLAGVPFLLKDNNVFLSGTPTRFSSKFLEDLTHAADSDLVRAWEEAGLVLFGKTNTPEFALSFSTEPQFSGPSKNPWDPSRTPGGSSGGAGAAVAARLVPAAHGNDAGGSIRVPSSACGCFGLKPTAGRVSLLPHYERGWFGINAEHVLTRTVRDSAAFLDCHAHLDARGSSAWGAPGAFADALAREPNRLKIAASLAPLSGSPVGEEVKAAFAETVSLLTELGHEVEEAAMPTEGFDLSPILLCAGVGTSETLRDGAKRLGREPQEGEIEPYTRAVLAMVQDLTANDLADALQVATRFRHTASQFLARYDVFLSPTLASVPLPLGVLDTTRADFDMDTFFEHMFTFGPYTAMFNLSGQPAMSVPRCWTEEGLPIGMQFAANHWREDLLFSLAAQLEIARPWANRRPKRG